MNLSDTTQRLCGLVVVLSKGSDIIQLWLEIMAYGNFANFHVFYNSRIMFAVLVITFNKTTYKTMLFCVYNNIFYKKFIRIKLIRQSNPYQLLPYRHIRFLFHYEYKFQGQRLNMS